MTKYKAFKTKYIIPRESDEVITKINFYSKPISKQAALDDVISALIMTYGYCYTFDEIHIISIVPFPY